MSASSIGPIGMPNASAASSTVSGAMPFVDAAHRRHQVRRQHAVDEEARRALDRQRQLVDLAHERGRRGAISSSRVRDPATISTSIMLRHRIEEVQADEARRIGQRGRDVLERNARRVRREDRAGLRLALERREQRALGVDVLEDRLDDDVGARDAVAGDVRNQPVGRVANAARILQAIGEQLGCALHRRRQPFRVLVLQRHRQSAQRAPGGDVAAHRAGADDVHVRAPVRTSPSLPSDFRRSCSPNTRIRFAAVGRAHERRDRRRIVRRGPRARSPS